MNHPTVEERLDRLARPEKWYLSPGDGILWAPAFPVWLHAPGFWDEAHIYYSPMSPLFTVALLSRDGREIPLRQTDRVWRPDRLVSRFRTPGGLVLREVKTVAPRGRFISEWTVESGDRAELDGAHLVAYTVQPGEETSDAARAEEGPGVRWRRRLRDRRDQGLDVTAVLTVRGAIDGARVSALRSEGSAVQPHWHFTPWIERWTPGEGLREELRLEGIHERGLVYAAVDAALSAGFGDGAVAFELRAIPVDEEARLAPPASESPWEDCFESFPSLVCSDPYIERYFDYRIYGLQLCRLEGGAGNVRHPAIAEGISYFHVPITYSGQCHMFEMRWCADPSVARGTLLNFLDTQKEDGGFHGRIYTNHLIGTDFYYANWGDGVLTVDRLHPSEDYLGLVYERLGRHADWMDRARDREGEGMYDVLNHFETGQEYMSRYQAVNEHADLDGWKKNTQLKAIDATVYGYQLKRALQRIALRLGRGDEATKWEKGAERIGEAILGRMWDDHAGFFSDVNPRTGERTGVKAAVCFYPMLTDLVDEVKIGRLLERLADPDQFATPWPVPSSSVDDPRFNADAEWKGKRHVCPWNGRVWPMTNSHVVEALVRQWRRRDAGAGDGSARARCGPVAADILSRYIRVMFHDRDLSRPNCFEHYNPYTGHACEYRGIDDYQHSWVLDLIVTGLCGVDVDGAGSPSLVVDPIPAEVEAFSIERLNVRGRSVSVHRAGDGFEVVIDGRSHTGRIGSPVRVELA